MAQVGTFAAAFAGLILSNSASSAEKKESTKAPAADAKGECHGVNSCKGKGECGGPGYDCAGNNTCKGKGWITLTAADCKKKGGKFKEEPSHKPK